MSNQTIRIGTRASKLAVTQTELFKAELLQKHPELDIQLVHIRTQGDKKQDTAQAGQGDKRDWIHEIEEALVNRDVDIAVHSGKDVPAEIHQETVLTPILKRESPFDAFIGKDELRGREAFFSLSQAATIGTSSLRRKAQLLRLRPDLHVVEHRGNVQTRIDKLHRIPEISGIVLAQAGLVRLGLAEVAAYQFSAEELLPAINQGTLLAQYRAGDSSIQKLISGCIDADTQDAWLAERGCVEVLQADCNSAVGIYATINEDQVVLMCRIFSHDGAQVVEQTLQGSRSNSYEIGSRLGQQILDAGGRELI